MTQVEKAKLLIKVSDELFTGKVNKEEVHQAYRLLPNLSDFEFGDERKIIAIKRYVTFNRQELEYDIANSDETIKEIEDQTPEDMPTELINEQTGDKERVDEYQLEAPATKPKHKGGRPKNSKNKTNGKK